MKKLTTWMIVLMLVPGLVVLSGCKKDEAEEMPMEDTAMTTEAPMETTPMDTGMSTDMGTGMDTGMSTDMATTTPPAAQ